jgi:hypothetical protein
MTNLTSLVNQLQKEHSCLASQLDNVSKALAALGGSRSKTGTRRKPSAAAIARIRAAQKARTEWSATFHVQTCHHTRVVGARCEEYQVQNVSRIPTSSARGTPCENTPDPNP